MRSLIKMEIPRYNGSDMFPIKELAIREQEVQKRTNAATHESSRHQTKIQSLFGVKKQQTGSFIQCETPELYRITSKPKKNINKYVSELTNEIENPAEENDKPKFQMLKKIIQHYDIKNLQKNDYSKLIKTFGLKIQTARTVDKKSYTSQKNRNFTIKPTKNCSRLSSLKNRMHNDSQVALLQFSKQFKKIKREETSKSTRTKVREKEKFFSVENSKKSELASKEKKKLQIKKLTPFKYQSLQFVLTEKMNKFRQFLFALNLSNHLYRDLDVRQYPKPLKYFVGRGNNANLIRSLMKKRFWYEETTKIKQANFIWTQIKQQPIFETQEAGKQLSIELIPEKDKKNKVKLIITAVTGLEENLAKIMTIKDFKAYQKINQAVFRKKNVQFGEKAKYSPKKIKNAKIAETNKVHNHLIANGLLGNKKGMFYSLREYFKLRDRNIFDVVPVTFHISKGVIDQQFQQFLNYFQERKKKKLPNYWIMKPGQFSNRGQGIMCSNKLEEIKKRVMKCRNGVEKKVQPRTVILQLYITNPLLYNNRKFDIRVFMLITIHNAKIKAYWYQEGYVRTSSYLFDLNEISDKDIHLTNDAIQKESGRYGKFQAANKLSFNQLQRYLDTLVSYGRNLDFYANLFPKLRQIASQCVQSSFLFLDRQRKQHNFQLFGLDFMVDYNFKPWLIEINTNPCLQMNCPLLHRIIPSMLENALRIGLDPIFPPPDSVPHNYKYNISENAAISNKFELIFDEERDGPVIKKMYENKPDLSQMMMQLKEIQEDQEEYQEEGQIQDYDI